MLVPSVPGRWVIISDRLPDLKGKGCVTGLVYDGFQNELPTASSFRRELWLTAGPQGSQDASWERFMENKTHTMTWATFGLSSDKVFTIYSASHHHPQIPAFCILSIIWVVPQWTRECRHLMRFWFPFLWVHTQRRGGWVIWQFYFEFL